MSSNAVLVSAAAALLFAYSVFGKTKLGHLMRRYLTSKALLSVHFFYNGSKPPKNLDPQQLPRVERIEQADGYIIRIVGSNPGKFTLQGTNTYLVGKGRQRILIDSGVSSPDYLRDLRATVEEEKCEIEHVVITHHHIDHEGGNDDVMALFPNAKLWKFPSSSSRKDHDIFGNIYQPLADDFQLCVEDEEANLYLTVHHTPGHTSDHIAASISVEKSRKIFLFTGDCILGSATPVFDDLYEYMNSLQKLKTVVESKVGFASILFPGHGPVCLDAAKKIQEYIDHRSMRDKDILRILEENRGSGVDVTTLFAKVYDISEMSYVIRLAARRTLKKHLSKLIKEGKIARNNAGLYHFPKHKL